MGHNMDTISIFYLFKILFQVKYTNPWFQRRGLNSDNIKTFILHVIFNNVTQNDVNLSFLHIPKDLNWTEIWRLEAI